MRNLLSRLPERYPALTNCLDDIEEAVDIICKSFKSGGKLLICGNGGSAADAQHIAGELLKGFVQTRPLNEVWRDALGYELAQKLQGGLPTIALPQFSSLITAFCNDCDPDYIFAQLTWALGQQGDVLLAISTSGNSKNILHAIEVAKVKGLSTIALTGHKGGQMADIVDNAICVPERETYKIQEYHLPIYHTMCWMIEEIMFGQE